MSSYLTESLSIPSTIHKPKEFSNQKVPKYRSYHSVIHNSEDSSRPYSIDISHIHSNTNQKVHPEIVAQRQYKEECQIQERARKFIQSIRKEKEMHEGQYFLIKKRQEERRQDEEKEEKQNLRFQIQLQKQMRKQRAQQNIEKNHLKMLQRERKAEIMLKRSAAKDMELQKIKNHRISIELSKNKKLQEKSKEKIDPQNKLQKKQMKSQILPKKHMPINSQTIITNQKSRRLKTEGSNDKFPKLELKSTSNKKYNNELKAYSKIAKYIYLGVEQQKELESLKERLEILKNLSTKNIQKIKRK